MIANSSYSRGSSGGMQRYMKTDEGHKVDVKNRLGNEIDKHERAAFTEKCQENEMWRHVSFSPDPSVEWDRDQLEQGVRRTMSEFKQDRPSLDYHYAVHDKSRQANELFSSFLKQFENDPGLSKEERKDVLDFREDLKENKPKDHVHVIMTGDQEDCEMWADDGDFKDLRETAKESFNEEELINSKEETMEMTKSLDNSFSESATMGVTNEVDSGE